jgi:hypothetical protein
LAFALAILFLAVPAASGDDGSPPASDGSPPCSFFAWTLTPPDYRIDPDCPPIQGVP